MGEDDGGGGFPGLARYVAGPLRQRFQISRRISRPRESAAAGGSHPKSVICAGEDFDGVSPVVGGAQGGFDIRYALFDRYSLIVLTVQQQDRHVNVFPIRRGIVIGDLLRERPVKIAIRRQGEGPSSRTIAGNRGIQSRRPVSKPSRLDHEVDVTLGLARFVGSEIRRAQGIFQAVTFYFGRWKAGRRGGDDKRDRRRARRDERSNRRSLTVPKNPDAARRCPVDSSAALFPQSHPEPNR